MNGLERLCRERRERGVKTLVPFVTAGFPDERTSIELLAACGRRGCGIVELGVPFSDPLADGPTIRRAGRAALDAGMTLGRALDLVTELRDEPVAPVLMTYLNPVLRLGLDAFAERAARAGCAGVIVPDMSLEDSAALRRALDEAGLALVDLVAPTTPLDRMRRIADGASGFLYLVAVAGVTGTVSASDRELTELIGRARRAADLPVYVGFGIDDPGKAGLAASLGDGVIVGSALMRRLIDHPGPGGVERALALVDAMLEALPTRRNGR